jgi:hypothetical protein
VLLPDIELVFDDPALANRTVGDVLADIETFKGETLADPLEGVSYGRCKAMIMLRSDGTPWINSFAHGRTIYWLKYDAMAVRAILLTVPPNDALRTLIHHVLTADLDEVEIASLIALAATQADVGIREINRLLKAARKEHVDAQARREQEQKKMARTDPRPIVNAPSQDAPWQPEMSIYDEILCAATDDIPPTRHIEDELNHARCIVVPGSHAFSSDSKDEPPAPQWHIRKLTECAAADILEKYIDFVVTEAFPRFADDLMWWLEAAKVQHQRKPPPY